MKNNKNKRIIIVGAGMGGLTAAAKLSKENYNVLVLDKNDRCGGLLNTFDYRGFKFDSGPRAFVNSGMVKPMLKELGIGHEFLKNPVSIGIENEMFTIESMDSVKEYRRILEKLYPRSAGDIEKIMKIITELSQCTRILYEFDNPNFGNVFKDVKYVVSELIPWTFKFLHALWKMNKFNMPMEDYLSGLSGNRSMIDMVTQLFFKKTPAYFALGYFYVYLDYFYPKGGTGVLADLVKDKILEWGGEIRLNTCIKEIIPSESVILDSEGRRYEYDQLIWAADLKTLFRRLNHKGLSRSVNEKILLEKQKMLASRGAESVFILFLGVNRPLSFFKDKGGAHLFYTPSKAGLGETHRGDLNRILENFTSLSKEEIFLWFDSFLKLNTFEISIPALRDSSLAPEGQTGIMISCLTDYRLFEKIEEAGWYDEIREMMENRIIQLLSQSVYKDLDRDIHFKFSSSPLTINRVSGSSEGAITGWSFESPAPVENKIRNIPRSALTAVPGVYKAGQWAYAPSGVPIAMFTGWYASRRIIRK